jgi:uncharacterized membrane protein YdbT with pleckstrin-like domain
MDQENLYYKSRPSWLNQMGSFLAMMILILMPFFTHDMALILIILNLFVALVIMLVMVYNRYAWEFRINDGNVQSRHGIMSAKENSIRLKNIRDIKIKQTTIQQIFGVGDIEFSTAGSSNSRIVFYGIEAPSALRDKILREQNKKEKGS